jgi:class 3 adenylate cyclase/tetratricopeptide (TPR) repeat protein
MVCQSCGSTNADGRKFCSNCGARLAATCPACGTPATAGDRYCGECGGPIGAAPELPGGTPADGGPPPAREAERRLVSVLFADLVGFTSVSEARDPEAVRELLTRYFDSSREIVERYGGTVEKFIGDAVMAVWGTPVAHEDDAERAVRAALELVETTRQTGADAGVAGMEMRAGVMTGEAVVTIGATGQGMVAGDLVNTASRIQSVAAPGTVLVGETTMHAASNAIAFEPAGDHVLKGKAALVPSWRALRVVAMVGGANRSEVLEPPFLGRDAEFRILKELIHATERDHRARLVSIIGPAGIGKSRLTWEFHKYIDGVVQDIYWHQGRSPAYGDGVTFWALGEMVRKRAGLAESDDAETTRERVAAAVDEYVPDATERRWIEPRLLHLLGIEDVASGEREELFAAWRAFFERVSERGPTVLLFEDLHWADEGLIDFVDHILEWSRDHPILVVTTARPELLDRRPDWGVGRRNSVTLSLEPLPDETIGAQLAGLVPGLPEAAVRQILERADGIPLYAVEIVRMLLHDGRIERSEDGSYRPVADIGRLEIPDSLQSLIAARLDSLEPEQRELLQDASVLGLSFTLTGLAAVAGSDPAAIEPRLGQLVRREFLVLNVDPRSPERGQYGFVHRLIREVAYATLAKRDRRARHLAAARHFETLGDEELTGILASHYLDAYRAAPEGDEGRAVAAQARIALRAAAERASALHSYALAFGYLEQALEVVSDPFERAELAERAGVAAAAAGRYEQADEYLRQAKEGFEEQGDETAVARATARMGDRMLQGLRVDEAATLLEQALRSLGDRSPDPTVVTLQTRLANAYMRQGEQDLAIEWAERALAGAGRFDMVTDIAEAMITRATALGVHGRTREAAATLEAARAFASEHDLVGSELRAHVNLSNLLWETDPRRGLEVARRGVEISERIGHRMWHVLLANNAIACATRTGEWDWALEREVELRSLELETEDIINFTDTPLIRVFRGQDVSDEIAQLREMNRGHSDHQATATIEQIEAWQAFVRGDMTRAMEIAEDSIAQSVLLLSTALLLAGRAAVGASDLDRVRTTLNRLDASGLHGPAIEAHRRTLQAGIAALEGRRGEAMHAYRDAANQWRSLGLRFDLGLTLLEMATHATASVRERQPAAEEARQIFVGLGAAPFVERIDELMRAPTHEEPRAAPEAAAAVRDRV